MKTIGVVRTPFTDLKDMPIQPRGGADLEAQVIIDEQYADGLDDIEGFTHLYLIYSFHKAQREEMHVIPFMSDTPKGVFSTRSPLRPNHLGLSIVRLVRREGNVLHINDVDILDNTPLLDIKPYILQFDHRPESVSGWMDASEKEVNQKRSDSRFVE